MNSINSNRVFVEHRNDSSIPPDRKISVIGSQKDNAADPVLISVIIPTADGYRNGYFQSLLGQLSEQTCQNFETIIIQGDQRQGRAINSGADIARGKYLITLDDDTQLMSPDAFEKLLQVLETDETVGMAGGINIIPEGASSFVRRAMKEIPRRSTPEVQQVTESDLAEHPLLIIRTDVFKSVGGENELIPRGLDPYLRMRFRDQGFKVVVVPEAYYSHLPPPTLSELVKQFFRNGKQAAYCNKFFPQWLIETPADHVHNFVEKRPFLFRVVRYVVNMATNLFKGRWIYILVYFAYALGFGWGYVYIRETD